ncbi:MAG: PD-(D/E)XK nuclease family protein [Chloroflexota bacterium]|nr:PD-(D/E)XK nuclease family protein [Chloroflexota bacterium]
MPLARFRCEVEHDPVEFGECLSCSRADSPPRGRRCQFTYPLLRALAQNDAGREGIVLSATRLTGCTRQSALELLVDYTAYPHQLYPRLRGALMHAGIEAQQGDDEDIIAERRFQRSATPEVVLTGQPDEIDLRRQLIVDYKTVKELPRKVREEHVWQLNMYRWLVQDGQDLVTGERVAYDIQQLGIVYLAPNEVYKRRVPLLPPEQVERFVAERGGAILQALDGEALPPRAWDPHSHPICRGWCPVRQQCLDAGEDGAGEFALDGEAIQAHTAPGR